MEGISWKVFLLLLGSGVCSAFAGLQSIVVLEWLQPLFLLQFMHHAKVMERKRSSSIGLWVLIFFTQTLGYSIAYAGEMRDPYFTFIGLLTVLVVSSTGWVILTFVFITVGRYELRFPEAHLSHPFAFPVVWATMWHLTGSFSPIGTTGNPAYTAHGTQPLVLSVALWGVDGIVFLMAWTASLLHNRLQLRQEAGQLVWTLHGGAALVEEIEGEDGDGNGNGNGIGIGGGDYGVLASKGETIKEFAEKVRKHDRVAKFWCGFLFFTLLVSGTKDALFSGRFFQQGIVATIRPTVGASCVLNQPQGFEETDRLGVEFLWNSTAERIRAGDGFIVWSETATTAYGQKGEDELLAKARQILSNELEKRSGGLRTLDHGPYLGLSYEFVLEGKVPMTPKSQYNVFTLLKPDGSVGFRYEKAHPVPFVELETIPGPGIVKTLHTPFGKVGAAICFDYQFPRLVDQASYRGADIMIQPSWTWGPMATYQFKADAFRAVENGFTLLRCSSGGQSGVVTANNEFVDMRESTTTSVVTVQLPITPKVFTLYPWGGYLFGMFLELLAVKYIIMAWLPLTWVLAISNFLPGTVNTFFIGDKFEEELVGKNTYRRYKTKTKNSTEWEVASRPFFARSQSSV